MNIVSVDLALIPWTMSKHDFVGIVKQCRGRIKSLLLHQQRIAGIGNIYANEMLFSGGIHPHAQGSRLSRKRIKGLFEAMQEILKEAILKGGSSIRDFKAPNGSKAHTKHAIKFIKKQGFLVSAAVTP